MKHLLETRKCVQAYDSAAEKQQWGGDRFACSVAMKDRPEVTGRVTIEDSLDGQYVCTYAPLEIIVLNSVLCNTGCLSWLIPDYSKSHGSTCLLFA